MIMSTKEICKRGLSMTISLTLGNTALPLGHGLAAHAQARRQLLLGQFLCFAQLRQPSGNLQVHGQHPSMQ